MAAQIPTTTTSTQKIILFPDGPGFEFLEKLPHNGHSEVYLVRSLKNGQIFVRKEKTSVFDPSHAVQDAGARNVTELKGTSQLQMPDLEGWSEYHDEE
ncbi:hypothetical protein LTR66_016967, partial [Elasticomyces elasticus]